MKTNPFSMTYEALWKMVERNPQLNTILSKRNRIKFGEEQEYKQSYSQADLPQLLLLVNGGNANIRDSSSTCLLNRTYSFVIHTGSYELGAKYDEICWELWRSTIDYDTVLCSLQWPTNWHFITKATTIQIEEGLDAGEEKTGIAGWVGVWSIEVQMVFRTVDLRITTQEFNDA